VQAAAATDARCRVLRTHRLLIAFALAILDGGDRFVKQVSRALVMLVLLSWPALIANSSGQEEPQQPASPQEQEKSQVKVKGRVRTRDGDPVGKAEVIYEGPKAGNTVTDSDGSFTFEGPAGAYKIQVKAGGKKQTFQRTIEQGTSLELIFERDD
jgi:hypothetical protein